MRRVIMSGVRGWLRSFVHHAINNRYVAAPLYEALCRFEYQEVRKSYIPYIK